MKLKRISNIVLGMLFIIMVYITITIYQSSKKEGGLPAFFGYTPLIVLSNSMEPTLESGDLIIIERVGFDSINMGDIITFQESSRKWITHRVVEKKQQKEQLAFVTKGDNNNVIDTNLVTDKQFIGKKVISIPKVGYVFDFAKSPIGYFLFIAIPLTIYVCISVFERLTRQDNQPYKEI